LGDAKIAMDGIYLTSFFVICHVEDIAIANWDIWVMFFKSKTLLAMSRIKEEENYFGNYAKGRPYPFHLRRRRLF
jgi:hypothetical protein